MRPPHPAALLLALLPPLSPLLPHTLTPPLLLPMPPRYRLVLPHLASVAPRDRMAEACPSQAPEYTRRFNPSVYNSC